MDSYAQSSLPVQSASDTGVNQSVVDLSVDEHVYLVTDEMKAPPIVVKEKAPAKSRPAAKRNTAVQKVKKSKLEIEFEKAPAAEQLQFLRSKVAVLKELEDKAESGALIMPSVIDSSSGKGPSGAAAGDDENLCALRLELGSVLAREAELRSKEKRLRLAIKRQQKKIAMSLSPIVCSERETVASATVVNDLFPGAAQNSDYCTSMALSVCDTAVPGSGKLFWNLAQQRESFETLVAGRQVDVVRDATLRDYSQEATKMVQAPGVVDAGAVGGEVATMELVAVDEGAMNCGPSVPGEEMQVLVNTSFGDIAEHALLAGLRNAKGAEEVEEAEGAEDVDLYATEEQLDEAIIQNALSVVDRLVADVAASTAPLAASSGAGEHTIAPVTETRPMFGHFAFREDQAHATVARTAVRAGTCALAAPAEQQREPHQPLPQPRSPPPVPAQVAVIDLTSPPPQPVEHVELVGTSAHQNTEMQELVEVVVDPASPRDANKENNHHSQINGASVAVHDHEDRLSQRSTGGGVSKGMQSQSDDSQRCPPGVLHYIPEVEPVLLDQSAPAAGQDDSQVSGSSVHSDSSHILASAEQPDFASMPVQKLRDIVAHYGLKADTKGKMVSLLKAMWQRLHKEGKSKAAAVSEVRFSQASGAVRLAAPTTLPAPPLREPSKKIAKKGVQPAAGEGYSQSTATSAPRTNRETAMLNASNTERSAVPAAGIKRKAEMGADEVSAFLRSNPEWYERVVSFTPIDLDLLHQHINSLPSGSSSSGGVTSESSVCLEPVLELHSSQAADGERSAGSTRRKISKARLLEVLDEMAVFVSATQQPSQHKRSKR